MNNENFFKAKNRQTEPTEQEFMTWKRKCSWREFISAYRDNLKAWKTQMSENNYEKRFDTYQSTCEHGQKILDYVSANPEKSYLFLGNNGTGKTHLAHALANHFIATYWEKMGYMEGYEIVERVTARDLSLAFRNGQRYGRYDGEDEFNVQRYYQTVNFLIIDEIGRTKNSEYFQDLFYAILDYRYEHKLQTLLISNLPEEAIKEEFGTALYDRVSNWCVTCVFDWSSFRPNQKI
jgi:DNA replication protein DnaC